MSQKGQFTINGSSEVKTLTGTVGGPVPATLGNIDLVGDARNIQTAGTIGTSTMEIALIGTTNHAVQVGNLGGNLTSIPVATNGQVLVGTTGGDPAFANLGVGNGISKTEGAGTLSIAGIQATTAQIGVVTLATNALVLAGVDSSDPVVSSSLAAKLGTQTAHGLPIGEGSTAAFTWTAAPTNGQLLIGSTGVDPILGTLTQGNNIGITNAAGSITIKLVGTTQHAVQIGSATNDLTSLAVGTNGQTLMGSTAADPGWTSSPQFGGSVTATNDITSTAGNLVTTNGNVYAGDDNNAADASNISFRKVRVAGIITTGDALGQLRYTGYDGVQYISGAKITSTSSGTIAATRVAGNLQFFTHPDAAIALPSEPLLRMTINSAGNVTVATPDSGTAVTVTGGGLTVSAGDIVATLGNINATAGSMSAGTTVTAGTGVTATTGGVTASAGNIVATLGNINATAGSMSAGTTVTAGTNLVSTAGNLKLPSTTATVGQITLNAIPYFHSYGAINNLFVGYNAGNLTLTGANASNNTAIGYQSLVSLVGTNAGNGAHNTAVGSGSLSAITDGIACSALGYNAGLSTTGDYNTFIGYAAGENVTSGGANTCIGAQSGEGSFTTGSYNTFLGHSSGRAYATGDSSNIVIGYGAGGTGGQSNQLFIGNGTGTGNGNIKAGSANISGIYGAAIAAANPVYCTSAGIIGTNTSLRASKINIEDMGDKSSVIYKLQPKSYNMKNDPEPLQFGFIAEEVEPLSKDLCCYDLDGKLNSVAYMSLIPMLVSEIQKQQKTILDLTTRLEALEKRS
jgi:Chaperone of endosialidase